MTNKHHTYTLRTYRYRVTVVNIALIVVVACVAFFFFWSRTTTNILLGVLHTLITLRLIECVVNTTYTLTPDGMLVINRGRMSRVKTIPINEILCMKEVVMKPFGTRIVLLEYGPRRMTSVQPQDCAGFINELKRRQDNITEALLNR